MTRPLKAVRPDPARGYTLAEMVVATVVLGIVTLVPSMVIVQSMKVYSSAAPAMNASYQANLAAAHLWRDISGLQSINSFAADALSIDDAQGTGIAYGLDGTDLKRNDDLLAQGVSSLAFHCWASDGTAAADVVDVHLIEYDLTVSSGGQPYRVQGTVFPRAFGASVGGGGGGAVAESATSQWRFDETSGNVATDHAGLSDGKYTHGVTLKAEGAPSGDLAAEFDGTNDYVEIPHVAGYLLDDGTIQLWFRAADTSGHQALFSKDATSYGDGGHVHIYLNGDDIRVRLQSTSAEYEVQQANVVDADEWFHVAFTFGSGGMALYLNGVKVDTDPYTGGLGTSSGGSGNTEPIAVGAGTWGSAAGQVTPVSYPFEGRIDSLAIYGEALSDSAIQALYAAGGEL